MNARQPISFDHVLDIVCDLVADVQRSILTWLVTDHQQIIELLLIDTVYTAGKFRKSLIGVVPAFVHNVDVEIIVLRLKQLLTELPKLFGSELQHCCSGLVYEGATRMPRLDLLSQDQLHARCLVLLFDQRHNLSIDRLEQFGAERADIVKIELDRMRDGHEVPRGR